MALTAIDRPAGAPWERPLAGALDRIVVHSQALEDNPLGDSAARPLYVYRPPAAQPDAPLPTVYVIQGYTGQVDMWLGRSAFEPTFVERLDAMFAAGDCPPANVVLVDAFTRLGGSQFLNSSSTGRYLDYLCDEVVAFVDERYATIADRDHRGLTGKSSGGYGAMVVPMLRPDVFGALASTSGDSLFECSVQREFPEVARILRDHYDSSYDVFFERFADRERFDYVSMGTPIEMYGYACAYSPDPERPGRALLPFEVSTGRLVDAVWARWLDHDPVRMVPRHADALRSMRCVFLEAGRSDEYFLDLGARAVSDELTAIGVEHTLELFDGRHGGITYRYPATVARLVAALS